ncbi:hypothetical protein FNH04_11310 [Streptomyces phyllanthi]|uniref:Uncharacterized protein n=2 Tax=Streptomyces phyllanthi TaxID=1803180 RepID=A0A5N8W2E0_9ACTN|nr:hypothetical protein [Streptomyces phyllanthi]MPY40474.1 hypothetical protein [Streptomyces phyllanthi]
MGTAERRSAPGGGVATSEAEDGRERGSDPGIPVGTASRQHGTADIRQETTGGQREKTDGQHGTAGTQHGTTRSPYEISGDEISGAEERPNYRALWVEEPARKRRMPDPVRTAAVRAVLIIAVTLVQAMVAFLCTMAGSWLAFPMVLSSVASTVVATWGALDVWVTRQVWNQRNGVVSAPSSTARALRRERRRARRQARAAARSQARIHRRQGRAGQLSHS